MAARCGVCLQPLRNGDKFGVWSGEIVHPRCMGKPLASPTDHDLRHGMRIAALERDLATATYELGVKEAMLRGAEREREQARAQRDQAITERDSERQARQAMQLELELRRSIPVTPTQQSEPEPISQTKTDGKDDTEQRFALLELD